MTLNQTTHNKTIVFYSTTDDITNRYDSKLNLVARPPSSSGATDDITNRYDSKLNLVARPPNSSGAQLP